MSREGEPKRDSARAAREAGAGAAPAQRWRRFAPLIVLGVALAAHGLCLGSIFYQDDHPHILNNVPLAEGQWWIWPSRVLVTLTYYLTYLLCGSRFWAPAYHLFNLLVHCGTALVLHRLLGELPSRDSDGEPPRDAERIALPAAVLFAAHPLATEVTNYVRARDIGLVTLLSMLAALCALRATRRDWRWAFGAAAAIVAACFTKEVGVVIAPICALGAAVVGLRDPWGLVVRRKWWIAGAGAAALVALAVALHLIKTPHGEPAWTSLVGAEVGRHVLTQSRVFWGYLGRFVIPLRLSSDHMVTWTYTALDAVAWLGLLGVAALAALSVVLLVRGRRQAGVLLALGLAPLLIRFPLVHMELMVEYRVYPALPWLCALAAMGFARVSVRRAQAARIAGAAACVILVILSAARCVTWWDIERLLEDVRGQYPTHMRAVLNMQEHEFRRKRFERVVELRPDLMRALVAAAEYNESHESRKYNLVHSKYWFTYSSELTIRSQAVLGRIPEGGRIVAELFGQLEEWKLLRDPAYMGIAYYARGVLYFAAGRLREAKADLERASRLKPLSDPRPLLREIERRMRGGT